MGIQENRRPDTSFKSHPSATMLKTFWIRTQIPYFSCHPFLRFPSHHKQPITSLTSPGRCYSSCKNKKSQLFMLLCGQHQPLSGRVLQL